MTNSEHALELILDGQIVGLGTGRAATAFVQELGERVKSGLRVRCVATSEVTATLARQVGIPMMTLDEALAAGGIDITIDGADEVDLRMNLIKGWGGAHVREKIVAAASRRLVILVTPEKLVPAVGSRGKLPVEVLPIAARLVEQRLTALSLNSIVRQADGKPFVTDNGNVILDTAVSSLDQPREFDATLRDIPGVVGTGLFVEMATDVFVQQDGWVEAWHEVARPSPPTPLPLRGRGGQTSTPHPRPLSPEGRGEKSCDRAVVRVFSDAARLSQSAAEAFVQIAQAAVTARGRFTVALAGGSTPKRLYELLATPPYRDRVDWSRTLIFFGDERCVPPDDADSNYRMAIEILLKRISSLSVEQAHRMMAERNDLDVAADDYAALIAHAFRVSSWTGEPPSIDLVLLGMGADGHTASLFPNTVALDETERWVVANPVPQLGTFRVTLTVPLLNAARQVMFLIAGHDKAAALADVLEGPADPQRLPSQLIRPKSGGLAWLVDQAAAARLKSIEPR